MDAKKTERFICGVCNKLYYSFIDAEECCSEGNKRRKALEEGLMCAECLKPLTDTEKAEDGFITIDWERKSRYPDDEGELTRAFFHIDCVKLDKVRKKAINIY